MTPCCVGFGLERPSALSPANETERSVRNPSAVASTAVINSQRFQLSDLRVPLTANAANVNKRPSGLVRIEQVKGSIPSAAHLSRQKLSELLAQ